jgi:hypothetical protein
VSTSLVKFFFWLYLILLVWAEATVTNPADPDLWHRLALGEYLCQTGHFPAGDYFSYLSDYKNIADHEWGSAVIFYGLYVWAGLDVFVAVKLVTLTLTLALIVWAGLYHRRPTLLTAAFYALILLALLPSFQSTVRCMTFTHVFFALWLYWFQCERHGRPIPTAFYALSMVMWANLHGGFIMGLVWLALVAAVEFIFQGAWKPWAVRFGVCSLATLINPFGTQLWVSTIRALLTTRSGFHEWEPVSWWQDALSYPGYKLLLPGLIVALAIQIYRRGWERIDRPVVILIGAFMALSLTSARHTSIFAAVAGALAPGLFFEEPGDPSDRHPLQNLGRMALGTTLILIPLFSALIVLPGTGLNLVYPHISCPRDAVAYLQIRKIRGDLLVPFNYGSYALWQLRGQMRVSMDGRYDLVYLPQTYRRVDDFFFDRPDPLPSLLDAPKPEAILVPIADPVYAKLQANHDWKEVYRDDTDAVFLPLRSSALSML